MVRTYDEEIHKRITAYFAKGPIYRWNVQNRLSMFGRHRVSVQTVGESKWPWRATLKRACTGSLGEKIG